MTRNLITATQCSTGAMRTEPTVIGDSSTVSEVYESKIQQ